MIRFILYFSPPKRLPPRVIVVVCTIGKKHKFTNITGVIRFGDEAGAGSSVGHNRVLLGFYAVWGQMSTPRKYLARILRNMIVRQKFKNQNSIE